ncbi:MAG: hypothetical protein KJP18_10830 [Gemmatimonadetes bacterium]|nr:hypothetical protein [Gemmatimonadota bacterium]
MSRLRELLRVEGRTLVFILAGLVVLEIGFRAVGDRLSGDVAHMDRIDDIVADLDRADAFKVLFVGNSLIAEGLDPVALEGSLSISLAQPVSVGLVRPDGSSPLEWYYLLDRWVFSEGRTPDLLVIPFGPGHLFDRDARQATFRLAAHHVGNGALSELLSRDLTDFEARSQFFLARVSRAYALRERIQRRALDVLIPDYRELAPLILRRGARTADTGSVTDADAPNPAVGRTRTLQMVQRLTARAGTAGVPVLFLAMPEAELWAVDSAVATMIGDGWPGLLDFRGSLALPPERFPDGEHMDSEGRERFTERLSAELLPTVLRLSEASGG